MLVTRDRQGKVNTFLNICRHRGNRLCRADGGNAGTFICAYHGWAYGADGKLAAVPNLQDAYYNELDQSRWGLTPVAQLDSYPAAVPKGLIFATFRPFRRHRCWSTSAPWPGTWTPAFFSTGARVGAEVIGGVHKWVAPLQLEVPRRKLRRRPLPRSLGVHLSPVRSLASRGGLRK